MTKAVWLIIAMMSAQECHIRGELSSDSLNLALTEVRQWNNIITKDDRVEARNYFRDIEITKADCLLIEQDLMTGRGLVGR